MAKVRSPLRYPGGKTRAIKKIMPHVPADIREYREPFVGGGSVYFAMWNTFGSRLDRYWINDIDPDLYHFWRFARDDNTRLADKVTAMRDDADDGRALYKYLKDNDNLPTDFDRAVRFFIMNRITFSGVMDAGGYSKQAFERRFTASSIDRLRNIERGLAGTKITNADYTEVLEAEGEDVFIFLDPPYLANSDSRLYGKGGEVHVGFDHERFAAAVKPARTAGC